MGVVADHGNLPTVERGSWGVKQPCKVVEQGTWGGRGQRESRGWPYGTIQLWETYNQYRNQPDYAEMPLPYPSLP